MPSIELDRVSIDFPIYRGGGRSLKKALINITAGGELFRDEHDRVTVAALHDLSLKINHGDRIGILGHNGAGKSTLLRVLAGAYEPSSGRVTVRGRVSSFLDLQLGFDNEATGYENIYLRALFMGLERKQIEAKIEDIVAFTELGDYLHMPVRTYSSGMRMRLVFSVATSVEPDILLMDEWFAAGDQEFREKASARLKEFVVRSGIFLIATHSRPLVKQLCDKVILLERGRLQFFGDAEEGLALSAPAKQGETQSPTHPAAAVAAPQGIGR